MRDFTGVPGASGGFADNDTRWTPEVGNALVQEVANVIVSPSGGNTPLDPSNSAQLLAAISHMIDSKLGAPDSETTVVGSQQWKMVSVYGSYGEGLVWVPFANPFPSACVGAVVSLHNASGTINQDSSAQYHSSNANGVYVMVQRDTSGEVNASGITVVAKGY